MSMDFNKIGERHVKGNLFQYVRNILHKILYMKRVNTKFH